MSTLGQAGGGLVGGIAGFFLGGPTGALYGAQIGLMVGGFLDPPKGPTINGPRLDDLSVQTSTYGAVVPRVYGTVTVNGNVFWLENNALKETITKKKSGGKGGGAKSSTRTYTYSATFAVGLCKGPIAGVKRIWIGADLFYDAGSSDTNTIIASNASATTFRFYAGTDTQLPDARMQATLGVANTPAWRGLSYIVFYDLDLTKHGNSLAGAQVRVETMQIAAIYTYPYTAFTEPSAQQWLEAAWDGTVYCSVAATAHLAMTSLDGLTWTQYSIPNGGSSSYQGVVSDGAGTLLAYVVGSQNLWRSTDHGVTWAAVTVPAWTGWITHIAWGGAGYLMATDGGPFFTSPDGVTWTSQTAPAGGGNYGRSIVWHPQSSKWYVIAQFGSDPLIYSSTTGATGTWTLVNTLTGTLNNFLYGCVHKRKICYIGLDSTAIMSWSDDGVTWTQTAVPDRGNSLVSDGDNLWTGTSGSSSAMYYSPDGVNSWTAYTGPSQAVNHWLCSANGFIVATGQGGSAGFRITKQLSSASLTTLDAIVSAECLQSGLLSAGDIDVTAITSTVRGYRIGSIGAIRAAIEPLQAAWPFDVRQHGYKIQCVARGGSSGLTIPQSDLDARASDGRPGAQITTSREMDSQIARRVTVQHLDYDREYNTGTQYAERLNTAAINATTLDLPIVLTATEAAGKAEVLLYLYWLERYDVAINLPPTYNQLEPADVVTLVTPEGNVSLRLTAVTNTSDGRVECKAKYANAAIYTPTAVGESSAVSGPTTITPAGASVYVLMDLPRISTAQDNPSFLAAMTGALTGWQGGSLMQSTDAGSTWNDLYDFGAPGTTLGTCSNSIGSVEHRVMDNASVLNVTLTQGALYSVTQLALLGGSNHFAYGVDGRWEIIAAQTCTLTIGTSYVLKDLLRGRFGTEWAMGLHSVSDSLVLLDTIDIAAIAMAGSGTIGLSYLYRGITFDRDISTDGNRTFAYGAVNLKPLAPIYLTGNRDSSNDWALSWIRRTRDGGEWRDNVDAALGEASEAYQIDIFSDGTYTTVKRTIATTAAAAAYTSADQTTDFGSNQGTLYLKLYQISATVGRGYPLTTSITR